MQDRPILDGIERELRRLRRMSELSLSRLDDEALYAARNGGNSAAVLMKHLSGNLLSRWCDFLTTDGEKPGRNRDSEFVITEADTRRALEVRWDEGWRALFAALAPLDDADLARTVTIRGEPHTVLQAVHRQLAHYAYHTGQIVLLAKELTGPHWESLSIPKGRSEAFNETPTTYLGGSV
ncbi:MAG: DUF1572 domain-containing protein [Candidatus Eisenbacteria bacterium]|nr:DUF1572 domain-containing protein [Candidatus Latescibacterota bacterium]MBD3302819.1 DUF1572 domain-containing protein [Candidatus Eisenbacteria bacterium]